MKNEKDYQKTTPINVFKAKQEARNLDTEARMAALGKMGDTLDYNKLRKEFVDKGKLLRKVGAKALGVIPILGGLASAAMSGDASAAVPLLDEAEPLGPAPGSFDQRLEQGQLTPEEKEQLRKEQSRIAALRNIGCETC